MDAFVSEFVELIKSDSSNNYVNLPIFQPEVMDACKRVEQLDNVKMSFRGVINRFHCD